MKTIKLLRIELIVIAIGIVIIGCGGKKTDSNSNNMEYLYEDPEEYDIEEETTGDLEIPFTTLPSGNITIPVKINGVTFDMMYDTGASVTMITAAEAKYMYQKGNFTTDDILNYQKFQTANGEISVGLKINLKKVELGEITLRNIEAVVVANQQAPLLLGQTVMREFGNFTVDYDKKVIRFSE